MLHIVLFEPEIPQNTGAIIRLAANCGFYLHLIEPLGFNMDSKKLRRAGLDYHEFTKLKIHSDFNAFLQQVKPNKIYGLTSKTNKIYSSVNFKTNNAIIFGPESRGLPKDILFKIVKQESTSGDIITIPMLPNSRSLNLANAASVVAYEAWRQLNFVNSKRKVSLF